MSSLDPKIIRSAVGCRSHSWSASFRLGKTEKDCPGHGKGSALFT